MHENIILFVAHTLRMCALRFMYIYAAFDLSQCFENQVLAGYHS